MVQYFKFFKPIYNPTGLTGTVGGSISTEEVLPRNGALFAPAESSPVVPITQYRKLFVKQVYDATMTGLVLQLANTEYSDQIYYGVATGDVNESVTSSSVAPTGVSMTGSYSGSVYITGVSTSGTVYPVWIKQILPAGVGDDDFVAFQLRILGTII